MHETYHGPTDFRNHVAICDFSTDALYLVCYHCQKQSKHVATLVDHLKSHGKFYGILFPKIARDLSLTQKARHMIKVR